MLDRKGQVYSYSEVYVCTCMSCSLVLDVACLSPSQLPSSQLPQSMSVKSVRLKSPFG
jgi:hypothetical protein